MNKKFQLFWAHQSFHLLTAVVPLVLVLTGSTLHIGGLQGAAGGGDESRSARCTGRGHMRGKRCTDEWGAAAVCIDAALGQGAVVARVILGVGKFKRRNEISLWVSY